MYFFDGFDTLEQFKEYDKKDNPDKLEVNSIKKKLEVIKWSNSSEAIENIADWHLTCIQELEYFYDVLDYAEEYGNERLSSKFLNGENIDLDFIKKGVLIILNTIKDYWKIYNKKIEEIRNKKIEQIKKLNATQLSELCLDILKEVSRSSIGKSNEEYLVDLIDSYELDLFQGRIKKPVRKPVEEIEIEELEEDELADLEEDVTEETLKELEEEDLK